MNSLDVAFNSNFTRIIASKFIIQVFNLSGTTQDDLRLYQELRAIAQQSVYNVTVFAPGFIYLDQVI